MERNFKENKVTISEDEFHLKAAEVMSNGNVSELISDNPILVLAFTMFTVALSKAIFDKNDNKNDDESEVNE